MSTTVDERVVSMQFDNRHFEKNVQTSLSTIEKLKKSLNLSGASKGLEDVGAAAKGVDMSPLSGAVENVGLKFNALHGIAYTALNRITNAALDAGKKIVSALTIDPVKMGFNEYELKMGSIQTIMASTGESLETVNQYLGELNEYSDKTIYSFQDMTSNIGKFTNAGVNLNDSVAAIKGISNVAAVSGANANEASRAMYNFAQALSSGYVKLIDWKSIENANMATVEFKNQLLETAAAEGTLTKQSDGTYKTLKGTVISATKNFNDSLQEQWMTSDALIGTLKKYADETTEIGKKASKAATEVKTFSQLFDTLKESAQSGWAQTWEILVGDFEEAKKLLASINDVVGGAIGNMAKSRNDRLENWKVLGGRDDLIEAFKNAFEGLVNIIKPIRDAFREIFPPATAEQLMSVTERIKSLTEGFKNLFADGTENADNLKRTFKGIFAIANIGVKVLSTAIKIISKVAGFLGKIGLHLLELTGIVGDWGTALNDAVEHTGVFNTVLDGVVSIVNFAIGAVDKFFGVIKKSFVFKVVCAAVDGFIAAITNANDAMNQASESTKRMKEAWFDSGIYKFLSSVWNIIKNVASGIGKIFSSLADSLSNTFGKGDLKGGFEVLNTILSGGVLVGIGLFVKKLTDLFQAPKKLVDSITDVFSNIGEAITDFGKKTSSMADNIKAIALALAILTASLILLSFIDSERLATSLTALGIAIGEMLVTVKIISGMSNLVETTKAIGSLTGLAVALLVMSFAIKKIGGLDWATWGKGILGVTGVMLAMSLAIKIIGKTNTDPKAIKKAMKSMISMSVALLAMSAAVKILAGMSWEEWARGLGGVVILLGAMVGVFTLMNLIVKKGWGEKKIEAMTKIFTKMAASLLIISVAAKVLGSMSWEAWGKAMLGIPILLAAMGGTLVAMSRLTSLNKNNSGASMVQAAGSIAIVAAALNLLIPVLTLLGVLPVPMLVKALGGMVVILAAMGGVQIMMTRLAGTGNDMLKAAGAIAIMSAAINLILPALIVLSSMPFSALAQGLLGLVAILAIMGGVQIMMLKLAGAGTELIKAAGAITIMALAINLLVPALLLLSTMSVGGLIISLAAMAGAFLVLGAAAAILAPLAPTIVAISSGLLMFSGAVVLAGIGLVVLGAGLVAIGKGLVVLLAGLAAIVGSIGLVAVGLTALIAAVIEGIIVGIGRGIVALCEVLVDSIGPIKDLLLVLVKTLCEVIVDCVPQIVDTVLTLITKILQSLAKFTPQIVAALVDLISGVITALAGELPKLIKAVVDLLFAFVEGVIEALSGMDSSGLLQALKNVGMLAGIMAALAAMAALAPAAMVGVLAMGLVVAELSAVLAAVGKLSHIPGLMDLVNDGGKLLEAIGKAIGSFIGGILGGIAKGVTSVLPEVGSNLSAFMTNVQPFIDGASKIDKSILDGVNSLVKTMLAITGASILDRITSFGPFGSSMVDFGKDLAKFGTHFKRYADTISGVDPNVVTASAAAASSLAEFANAIPKSGGLAQVFSGKNNIATFGLQLIPLAVGLKGFSLAADGINADNVTAAATATKALAEVANNIPKTGGFAQLFKGENNIALFGVELVALGAGIKEFSVATEGIVPENIVAAASAAKAIAEMTNNIPNSGGMVTWFTGDNSIANFADELVVLGQGLSNFASMTSGINAETVSAAASAAKTLAEMTEHIPNEGGMVSWFTGENSIAKFGDELASLGAGLALFASTTSGINPETVSAAASAAKTLAEMTSYIPNEGGIKAFFSGDSSLSKFSGDIVKLGEGLKGFATTTEGINPETTAAASEAAKNLAEMSNSIPNEKGIKAWFTGEASISKFSDDLIKLGHGIKSFSKSVEGVNAENITAAAGAAKALAEMTSVIPKEGGIKAWFTGDSSISNFADKLPGLGKGLKGFSDSVVGINAENLTAASNAAKAIGEMVSNAVPNLNKVPDLAENLPKLGTSLKNCFDKAGGISEEAITSAKNAVTVIQNINSINVGNLGTISTNLDKVVESIKNLSSIPKDISSSFSNALAELGKTSTDSLVKAFKNIEPDMKTAGESAIKSYIKGINDTKSAAEKACTSVAEACADAISGSKSGFSTSGGDLVDGFVGGISANSFKAQAAAKAMAQAALAAANEALRINSPSKAFRDMGYSVPEGFAIGVDRLSHLATTSTETMATDSISNCKDAISRIASVINSDIDAQPTIRPVLDLSGVRNGANSINGMFGNLSPISAMTSIGAISSSMRQNGQNGDMSQIVSEIDKLNKNFKNMDHATYNINGVTFSGGSEVEDAFRTILRAAKIERRS